MPFYFATFNSILFFSLALPLPPLSLSLCHFSLRLSYSTFWHFALCTSTMLTLCSNKIVKYFTLLFCCSLVLLFHFAFSFLDGGDGGEVDGGGDVALVLLDYIATWFVACYKFSKCIMLLFSIPSALFSMCVKMRAWTRNLFHVTFHVILPFQQFLPA